MLEPEETHTGPIHPATLREQWPQGVPVPETGVLEALCTALNEASTHEREGSWPPSEFLAGFQSRIRELLSQNGHEEMAEVLEHAMLESGSVRRAWTWYFTVKLDALGNETAAMLVAKGHTRGVMDYITSVASGSVG